MDTGAPPPVALVTGANSGIGRFAYLQSLLQDMASSQSAQKFYLLVLSGRQLLHLRAKATKSYLGVATWTVDEKLKPGSGELIPSVCLAH